MYLVNGLDYVIYFCEASCLPYFYFYLVYQWCVQLVFASTNPLGSLTSPQVKRAKLISHNRGGVNGVALSVVVGILTWIYRLYGMFQALGHPHGTVIAYLLIVMDKGECIFFRGGGGVGGG